MTQNQTALLTERLLFFALFLQGLEIFWLARGPEVLKIWSFRNLQNDFVKGLPLPKSLIQFLFADRALAEVARLQCAISLLGIVFAWWPLVAVLFFTHLTICLRFRGVFNGGSDIMGFVVLSGLLITRMPGNSAPNLGLIYIAIHGVFSYARAGHAKLVRSEWRDGQALPIFLGSSLFLEMRRISSWLKGRKMLCVLICWSVILFELSAAALPFFSGGIFLYFFGVLIFHLSIYFMFGLNRFFWTWLCAWPSIFYSVSLLHFK